MNRITTKWRLLIALLCMSITSLLAEVPEGGVSFKTSDFAPAPDSAFSIDGKAALAVYQAFRKAHPNLYPESNAMSLSFEGAAGEAPLLMSIAGGTAPDVMQVNTRQSGSFIGRNFIQPLDDFINPNITADEARAQGTFDPNIMYKEEFEERVLPPVRKAVMRTDEDGKKHVYILPFSYLFRALAYNKTLFQTSGLDPIKDAPKTWEDMYSIAQKLQKPAEQQYGMLLSDEGGASWAALPLFFSMGSQIVEQNATTKEWRATFNDSGSIRAADYYLKLVEGPWMNPQGKKIYGVGRSEGVWPLWKKGRVGMAFLYLDDVLINKDPSISSLNPEEVGLMPIPQSPIGTSITEMHMRGLAISATSKDPEKIKAAWKFIRFVGSPAAKKVIIKTYVENGYGNYIDPEKLKRHGYEEYVKYVPPQWAHALKTSRENCAPEPYGKNCQVYIERASKPLQTAFAENLAHNPNEEARISRLQELYDEAVNEINEKMLGKVDEEVMVFRRKVTGVALSLMVLGFLALFIYVWKLFTPPKGTSTAKNKGFRKYILAYILLTPALGSILVFNYYPLVWGAVMAFQDYNVVGGSTWVGLDNFAAVIFDKIFWISILRTGEYVLWSLTLVFIPPILLAIILSEIPKGNIVFRIIYYLPAVVSGLVVMIMWKMFFAPTEAGMLNQVLAMFGVDAQKWLQDPDQAMFSIILPLAWAGMGPGCLIYLAALKTVPDDLYEAAAIDGAGFFGRVWSVTLPTIRPLVMIQLIFVLIGTFQSADNVLVMTGGGPDYASHVIGLEIFYNAYVYLRFGVAVAIAWILGFILVGLTMFQMRRISRMNFTTAENK